MTHTQLRLQQQAEKEKFNKAQFQRAVEIIMVICLNEGAVSAVSKETFHMDRVHFKPSKKFLR